MPDQENAAQGVVVEKQNWADMLRWEFGTADDGGHLECIAPDGTVLGRVRRCIGKWENIAKVGSDWVMLCKMHFSEEEARAALVEFWRAAAKTAKELGL